MTLADIIQGMSGGGYATPGFNPWAPNPNETMQGGLAGAMTQNAGMNPYGLYAALGAMAQQMQPRPKGTQPGTLANMFSTLGAYGQGAIQGQGEQLRQKYLQAQIDRMRQPEPRKIIKGADGFNYYADTGERVLKDVKKPEDEQRRKLQQLQVEALKQKLDAVQRQLIARERLRRGIAEAGDSRPYDGALDVDATDEEIRALGKPGMSPRQYLGTPEGVSNLIDVAPSAALSSFLRPAAAPKTREIKRGGKVVTEQWNPATGRYERIAEADRWNPRTGGPSEAQKANNIEIETARRRIMALKGKLPPGVSLRDYVLDASQKATDTGRQNTNYDPLLERDFRIATQRMVGPDQTYEPFLSALGQQAPPPPAPLPGAQPPQQPGLWQRIFGDGPASGDRFIPGGGYDDVLRMDVDNMARSRDPFGGSNPEPTRPSDILGTSQQTKMPSSLPMTAMGRIDRTKLATGRVYRLKDGQLGKWNGSGFELVK